MGVAIANLREAYSSTALAPLDWGVGERPIDRVAASGRCDATGLAVWKARYQHESSAYNDAIAGLLKDYRERFRGDSADIAKRVVTQALDEFLFPFCSMCSGAKEVIVDKLRVICPKCGGSGVKRYSDSDRARQMRLSWGLTKKLAHKLRWAHERLSDLDRSVNAEMAFQLER